MSTSHSHTPQHAPSEGGYGPLHTVLGDDGDLCKAKATPRPRSAAAGGRGQWTRRRYLVSSDEAVSSKSASKAIHSLSKLGVGDPLEAAVGLRCGREVYMHPSVTYEAAAPTQAGTRRTHAWNTCTKQRCGRTAAKQAAGGLPGAWCGAVTTRVTTHCAYAPASCRTVGATHTCRTQTPACQAACPTQSRQAAPRPATC